MNIAVISVRDLFKYILKFCLILAIVLLLVKGIKEIVRIKESNNIKENINTSVKNVNDNSFLFCLDLSLPLISYKKDVNNFKKVFKSNKVISMSMGILDDEILKNTDLVINKNELTQSDIEELKNNITISSDNTNVENVLENNIIPKVTNSYGSVKIDNQSDYEITEDMLVPNVEITNKKDVLIYHTHTCESYTPSPRL